MLCAFVSMCWWVEELLALQTRVLCVCATVFLRALGWGPGVLLQESEMGAASERGKLLSGSVALLIVPACVFVCVRAQECARLCSAACADENRVAALHLKGAAINEMNKRP